MLMKPSVVLQVQLQPDDYSAENADEIKRSFIYLAQSLVSELPPEAYDEGNIMRLSIRVMRAYWDIEDEKAQELWTESVLPWVRNITRNMSTAMHNYNTVGHPVGAGNIVYRWVDYEFDDDMLIRVRVDADNRISAPITEIVDLARTLMNKKQLGDGIALIRVPSLESMAEQRHEADDDREPSENLDGKSTVEESENKTAPLQYRMWGIERVDGSSVEYDSGIA